MDDERREEEIKRDPLERIADALEALASEPEIEIEKGPPICPHCGAFDPEVILPAEDGGQGKMSQIVIGCQCTVCASPVYIAIDSYSVHRTQVTLQVEMDQRKAGNNGS